MNHIYLGLTFSLICLFIAYFILSKVILVTVLCVILAGLYFKDDFSLFRYIAARVTSFYSWILDLYSYVQNMYHQSNSTNFPIRKIAENNGSLSRKFDKLQPSSSYNLSTSYAMDNQSISGLWGSGSKYSSPLNNFSSNRTQSTLQEMSKLKIGLNHRLRGETSSEERNSKSYNSTISSPMKITYSGYSRSPDVSRSGLSPSPGSLHRTPNIENKPPLNAKLFADVSSPGFCGRVAERMHEEDVTHQSKYDSVGAFPVVNLKTHSPKIKIKTPVRVRLAPPSNEHMHYNYGVNTLTRSPILGPDESMKSVLQVLKEISRKRIHSHIDEENEESSKRLRVTDSQFDSDGLLHTSILQQTIQGKRAREESSPNEDDKKRRKASLKNNEILSSLSSSISIRPPHLQSAKRKAQSIDDSITSTPVLGKLLKVQTEITPPAPTPTNHIAAPEATQAAVEVLKPKTSPLDAAIPSPIVPPPAAVVPTSAKPSATEPRTVIAEVVKPEEEGAVSRLLGRMTDQTNASRPVDIPVKKNVFMSTNDLSLSPPKENRLAAMIAVLGGPSEQSELENSQPEAPKQSERLIKGKALFTTPDTPATPETPKQNKKVTFSDSLTTTKIYERDEPDNGNTTSSNNSVAPPSTPLSSVSFGAVTNTTPTGPKLNFGSENTPKPFALNFGSSPLSSTKEANKTSESGSFAINTPTSSSAVNTTSPGNQRATSQIQSTNVNFASAATSAIVSAPTLSVPVQVSSSNLGNVPSTGGFSFGTNSSLVSVSKESSPKQNTDSPSVKPFSFGSETKTSQPATTLLGFPSIFSPASTKNETTKGAAASGQNKPTFNMFGNKDSSSAGKKEGENKPLVNGFTPASSSASPFSLSQPINQSSAVKPLMGFSANTNPTSTPSFNFGSTPFSTSTAASLTTQQSTASTFTSTTQQSNAMPFQSSTSTSAAPSPSLNIFSSSTSSPAQNKPSPFGSSLQGTPTFGDNLFKTAATSIQNTQASSVFGSIPSQSTAFGSTTSLQNGAVSSTSGTSQSSNLFGNVSSNPTSKPITFGNEPNTTSQSSTVFGFSGTPTSSTQTNSPFGITLNNSTANTPSMFGNPTTSQTSVFGSGTPNTSAQNSTFPTSTGQPSLFGNINSNDTSKNMFASASNATPTFGGSGNTSSPAFGNSSNPAPAFGGQSTTATSTFGNQSTPAFTFGSHNTGSNPAPGGFSAAGTFGGSSSGSSSNEAKPPAFGSATPFMFGSSSSIKPTEAVKPLGTATPFAFGSSAQQNSSVNPAQPSVPSFGAATSTFGTSQPAPTFGTTPTAAPTFQFGPGGSSAAPTFQFNAAAPPTVGGGMFSIGSGGSSTSRPKPALRRSHKRT